MTYSEYFSSVKTKFMGADVSDMKEQVAYQFNVTGEASGVFYVEIKEGQLFIEPYEYFDRDVMFTASADVFIDIMDGTLDPIAAVTMQKMKVEGNIDKAIKFSELVKKNKK